MKKQKILSVLISAALGMTAFAVPTAVSAEDNGIMVSDSADTEEMIYGDIKYVFTSGTVTHYTGDMLDLSDVKLRLATYSSYNSNYAYSSAYNCVFTVGSGLYSDTYTLDTSGVDLTKAGRYDVVIKPIAGAVGTFSTKDNWVEYGEAAPDGDYEICMKGNEAYIPVTVYDREAVADTPLYLRVFTEFIDMHSDGGTYVELVGALASDVRYEIEDESIAEISADSSSGYLVLNGLKEGETTVHVYTSDGRTTSEKIRVLPPPVPDTPPEEPIITTTTTIVSEDTPYTTTTPSEYTEIFTTTTTKVYEDTPYTTTTVTENIETSTTSTKWWYQYETTTTMIYCSTGTLPIVTVTETVTTTSEPETTATESTSDTTTGPVVTSTVITSTTTTVAVTSTDAGNGETTLPQTGYSGVYKVVIGLAVLMTAGGSAIIAKTRKENE